MIVSSTHFPRFHGCVFYSSRAIVTHNLWLVGNFKETQIGRMRPGQPVEIRADAYPDKVLRRPAFSAGAEARTRLRRPNVLS